MKIPGLTQIEIAELADIETPKAMIRKKAEAQAKLDRLLSKITNLREQVDKTDIPALQKEAAIAIADGKDDSKIQTKIKEAEQSLRESRTMLSELEALQPGIAGQVVAAKEAIADHIAQKWNEDHAEMLRQLEAANNERARNIGTSPDGKYHSAAPKNQSRSRVAVCEACMQPIAIFDPKKITQPVTGADFQKLGAYEKPFPPGCEFMWLRCPRCGAFPWREEDKILTTAGYYSVPAKEKEKHA